MEASHPPHVEVRIPREGEGAAIAEAHVRSWQVGYRGVFPDDYLADLTPGLPDRATRWDSLIERDAPLNRLLVATLDDQVVAFASFGPAGAARDHVGTVLPATLGEVYAFYTRPDHWRKGVGRALMTATTAALAGAGFSEATLWVLKENPRARGFYEATGWRPTGEESVFRRDQISAAEVCYRRPLP